jgi:hypothetical protein
MRERLIARHFPALDPSQLAYLAAATSGLWGQQVVDAVRRYVQGGSFVERRYHPGSCPTHPEYGVVMERGFFPDQVERSLVTWGFEAVQVHRNRPIRREADRGRSKNFTIRGTKLPEAIDALQAHARTVHARAGWRSKGAGRAFPKTAVSAVKRGIDRIRQLGRGPSA